MLVPEILLWELSPRCHLNDNKASRRVQWTHHPAAKDADTARNRKCHSRKWQIRIQWTWANMIRRLAIKYFRLPYCPASWSAPHFSYHMILSSLTNTRAPARLHYFNISSTLPIMACGLRSLWMIWLPSMLMRISSARQLRRIIQHPSRSLSLCRMAVYVVPWEEISFLSKRASFVRLSVTRIPLEPLRMTLINSKDSLV